MKSSFLFIFLILSLLVQGQTYYVSTSGDDGNSGLSLAEAWGSLQHAMDVAEPGSTVYIGGGTYNERCYVNVDGTEGLPIQFVNYNNEEVVIDGSGLIDAALLELYDSNYIRIEGIHFTNNVQPDAIGVLIEGNSSNIEIINCEISQIHFSDNPEAEISEFTNSQPLIAYGNEDEPIRNLLISGTEIHHCRTGYSEALAINGNIDGFELIENRVHDISNIGIDIIGHEGTCSIAELDQARNGLISGNYAFNCLSPYATAAGIYVDGGKDLVIERNHIYQNQWGIEIGCENPGKTASGIVLRNNFIYSNQSSGLALGGYDFPLGSGAVVDLEVRNNSLFNNDTEDQFSGELFITYLEQTTISQNIFYSDNFHRVLFYLDDGIPDPVELVLENNLWYSTTGEDDIEIEFHGVSYSSFSDYQSLSGQDANSAFADPLYVSVDNGVEDLHLQPSSPARNSGSVGFVPAEGELDIDGDDRLNGLVDLGADEFQTSVDLAETEEVWFDVFPNPAQDVFKIRMKDLRSKELVIYSMGGQAVLTLPVERQTMAVSCSHLAPGIYVLKLGSARSMLFID